MALPPSTSPVGIGTIAGCVIAVALFTYVVVSQGESTQPGPTASPPTTTPPAAAPRCARKDVFDQALQGSIQSLRDYLRECAPSGAFTAQANTALESRLYESSLACIRSSCAPDACLSNYTATFPNSGKLASLRNEIDAARNSQRCRPVAATFVFKMCNHTPFNVQIAVMGRQTPEAPWVVRGWLMAASGACGNVGNFAKGEFYAVAIGPNGMRWGNQDAQFCVVSGQAFQRPRNPTCQPDEVPIGFQRFQMADEQFTWNLTSNAPPPPPRPLGRPVDIGVPTQIGR